MQVSSRTIAERVVQRIKRNSCITTREIIDALQISKDQFGGAKRYTTKHCHKVKTEWYMNK